MTGPEMLMMSVRVHDVDPHSRSQTYRLRPPSRRRQRIRGNLMRRLSHSVRFKHGRAKDMLESLHRVERKRCAGRTNKAKVLRALGPVVTGARNEKTMHRWNGRIPCRPVIANGSPERQRIELLRNDDRAREQCGQRRSQQSVDVEQGHHGKGDVIRRKFVSVCDVLGRHCKVSMSQRHAFRPAGGSARVKNQCDVVGARWRSRSSSRCRRESHTVRRAQVRGKNRDVSFRRRATGFISALGWQDEQLRVGIFQVEGKLVVAVGKIQRGCRPRDGCGKEANDGFKTVGKRHRDPASRHDPGACKSIRGGSDLAPQRVVCYANTSLRQDDCSIGRRSFVQQLEQRHERAGRFLAADYTD